MLEICLQPNDTEERCGLILKDGAVIEVPNVAKDSVIGYVMDPTLVLPYLTADVITGTWHTHPNGTPTLSGEDLEGFMGWPDLKHFIIGLVDGKPSVRCYMIDNGALLECE